MTDYSFTELPMQVQLEEMEVVASGELSANFENQMNIKVINLLDQQS